MSSILKYYLIGMILYAIYHFSTKTFWELKELFKNKEEGRWLYTIRVFILDIPLCSLIFPIPFTISMISLYYYLRTEYYIWLNKKNNPNWRSEDGDWDRF